MDRLSKFLKRNTMSNSNEASMNITEASQVSPSNVNANETETTTTAGAPATTATNTTTTTTTNVVTIPVPIVHSEEYYCYVTVKGSLHDRSCSVFGLNETEIQALTRRFESSVKPVVNGVMVSVPPIVMLNTLAELSYKVICSCGEAEICWTMQREV